MRPILIALIAMAGLALLPAATEAQHKPYGPYYTHPAYQSAMQRYMETRRVYGARALRTDQSQLDDFDRGVYLSRLQYAPESLRLPPYMGPSPYQPYAPGNYRRARPTFQFWYQR
jgi:hypothetical protein